ncbi:MAG: aminodeoxychorismate synthase component I [Gammaproteobacteria bacterium]|nr:aminodeoxychorismate synthase component I [Gammaproteobacteria bacterium]MCP5196328.1 aminodeoxychorismate synthase component I [Gammaproteobacteria bacterium]
MNTAVIQTSSGVLRFAAPERVIVAMQPDEVTPALREIENIVNQRRQYAVGFMAYEAAAAYGLSVHPPWPDLPLLCFGLYAHAEQVAAYPTTPAICTVGPWRSCLELDDYAVGVQRIRRYLADGHSYQVNYTFGLETEFAGEPQAFFTDLAAAQQGRYAACIDMGRFVICSASPELFFRLEGEQLTAKPMKGTARRGRTLAEDESQRVNLRQSDKNRAENLMITDMVRNDLGRVARIGSVAAAPLFEVECYPTVLQMTSTVTARTSATVTEILQHLFPSASITGAPKVRTMAIIRELESQPRGVYTGTVGMIAPDRQAQFNVAIRSVLFDRERQQAFYGVGSGIVWDSDADDEYQECLLKAQVLTRKSPSFQLLESLLWEPGVGYFLLDAHLRRLANSAAYFDFSLDRIAVEMRLAALATTLTAATKVRLLVSPDGVFELETTALAQGAPARPVRVGWARQPVDSSVCWLYHKTTERQIYQAARATRPDCDEVLLWNERGELTEASTANVVLELGGARVTPPVACGLLAGTFRSWLLAHGHLQERILTKTDLYAAQRIYLINAVRRWQEALLII